MGDAKKYEDTRGDSFGASQSVISYACVLLFHL